jgi:putative ATPase
MQPLAERMRPTTLDDYIGQDHIIGRTAPLRKNIENGIIPSMIFWGPPGVGKTTLAKIISSESKRPFYTLSAVNSGVKDVREVIDNAKKSQFFNSASPILFIDEIHRFNKSQQDSLLAAVENGTVVLIGATTENPSFEVITPLLSRAQVYVLKELTIDNLKQMLNRAMTLDSIFKTFQIEIKEYEALLRYSGGDGRKLLNILELVVNSIPENPKVIDNALVELILQEQMAVYDKGGEMHYDIISAFIKSIRGSDPNAAVYWLARMLDGGEDVKFIARRLIILAAEDIGLSNPNALLIANQAFQAVNVIGMPEARIILSEAALYLALSPKSNSAYLAIDNAMQLVKQTGNLSVPLSLRNAPSKLMKDLGYGKGYRYSHDYPNHFVAQEFLPKEISNEAIFKPANNQKEHEYLKQIEQQWGRKYSK